MLAINFLSEFEYILGTSPKSSQISMLNTPSSEWGVPYPERPFETSMAFFWIIFHQLWNSPYFCCEGLFSNMFISGMDFGIHHIQIRAPRYSKDCRSPSCRCARILMDSCGVIRQFLIQKIRTSICTSKITSLEHTLRIFDIHHFLTSLFFPKRFCIYIEKT